VLSISVIVFKSIYHFIVLFGSHLLIICAVSFWYRVVLATLRSLCMVFPFSSNTKNYSSLRSSYWKYKGNACNRMSGWICLDSAPMEDHQYSAHLALQFPLKFTSTFLLSPFSSPSTMYISPFDIYLISYKFHQPQLHSTPSNINPGFGIDGFLSSLQRKIWTATMSSQPIAFLQLSYSTHLA